MCEAQWPPCVRALLGFRRRSPDPEELECLETLRRLADDARWDELEKAVDLGWYVTWTRGGEEDAEKLARLTCYGPPPSSSKKRQGL